MPDLDYRDVRTGDLSLADLIRFDDFIRTMTSDQQEIVNRKIAHEVNSGEPASKLRSVNDELDDANNELTKMRFYIEGVDEQVKSLTVERTHLLSENTRLEREISETDINVANLRRELSEAAARHGRELQEAEVRGFQRGRAEAAA